MKKIFLTLTLVFVFGSITGATSSAQAQSITAIGGYNAMPSVSNGRWTGQPDRAPSTASNQYKGFLAVDTMNGASYWTINGSGFGTARGSVGIDPGFVGPVPYSVSAIQSWSDNSIRVTVVGNYSMTAYRNVRIWVRTSRGTVASRTDNVVAVPAGRGFGQCTWEVFFQRKSAGFNPPPQAYVTNAPAVGASYIPRQWDVLYWGTAHTAIITSAPQVTRGSDGRVTYTFTLTERNASWNEQRTVRTSSFAVRNGVVAQGIISNMNSRLAASSFWR
jgi:hypothetical protein